MNEQEREKIRMAIQDAVYRAIEAGWSENEVREEVDYTIEDTRND